MQEKENAGKENAVQSCREWVEMQSVTWILMVTGIWLSYGPWNRLLNSGSEVTRYTGILQYTEKRVAQSLCRPSTVCSLSVEVS